MKKIMKRAWEIYRTLTGTHKSKISIALKKAWSEVKAMTITKVQAVENFLKSKGYETKTANKEISAKRIITVLYKDFKNDPGLKMCESVKGTYDAEKKTIQVIDDIYIYVNGNKEIEVENAEAFAIERITKQSEGTKRYNLLNAINY